MYRILPIAIDAAAGALVFIPLFAVLGRWLLRHRNRTGKILFTLFAIYLTAVFSATGIPWFRSITVTDLSVNLIPFADIVNSPADYIKNSLLNIILFIPAGMFLPLLWKEFQVFKNTALFGLGLSLAIELLQIFTFRLTDIDDLITNTLGCVTGFLISKQLFYVLNGKLTAERGNCKVELPVLIGVVFLVCFTVQPYLAEYFWMAVLAE